MTEITAEAKKSKAYQTYTVSITAKVNKEEDIAYDPTMDLAKLQGKCREMCQRQLDLDGGK